MALRLHDFDALVAAINRHNAQDVHRLIEAGAPFQERNNVGLTPLIMVCAMGDMAIARVLAEAGADVNATGLDNATALMWAARNDSVEMVSLLLRKGAVPDARDSHGRTALFYAAESPAKPEVISVLLDAGADAAARDADGKTPLDIARVSGVRFRMPFTGLVISMRIPFSNTRAADALRSASKRK